MNLDISIGKKDVGFRYDQVKSLLKKFDRIERHKEQLERFAIHLEMDPSEFHELSGAIIWRLALHYRKLPCKKYIDTTKKLQGLLQERGFFTSLVNKRMVSESINVPIKFNSFDPVRNAVRGTKSVAAEAIYEKAMLATLDRHGNEFDGEVYHNILEVLINVFDHSEYQSEAGIVCTKGEDSSILNVCVVDMGQGIRKSIFSNPKIRDEYAHLSEEALLREVTQHKVSCNPSHARHPKYPYAGNAGMGLYYLSLLSRHHRAGQLIMISGKGYYYVDSANREIKRNLGNVSWPGTIVFFRIDLRQELNPLYRDIVRNYK